MRQSRVLAVLCKMGRLLLPTLVVAYCICARLLFSLDASLTASKTSIAQWEDRADCVNVFIDAGSNIGVHGRFFFEPSKYPKAKFKKIFRRVFGDNFSTSSNSCVYAFEPNPRHAARQQEIAAAYNKNGWRYYFIPAAISDEDGFTQFYTNHRNNWSTRELEVGFGAVQRASANADTVTVRTIDFHVWLQQHVFTHSGLSKPRVLMKIDVEGAELRVLLHLLIKGTLCNFDKIIGEFHPVATQPLVGQPSHPNSNESTDLKKSLNKILLATGCAPFEIFDDESYIRDGMALP